MAQDLGEFRAEIRAAALAAGVSPATVDASLRNFQPIGRVIELDQKQPEKTQSLEQYLDRQVTEQRIGRARSMYDANAALLGRIGNDYHVPPSVLVALWGMESNFGATQGDWAVIPSLATLAYEGRRHDFFKGELIKALQIVDAGDVSLQDMTGSWAGAMGQVQFMPSTFLSYAVDYSGTGKRDIWHDNGDALASAANYLARLGWQPGQPWGREVTLPQGFDAGYAGLDKPLPISSWQSLGVLRTDGERLAATDGASAALLIPDGPGGRAFLAYDNFQTLMRWNHSQRFVISVGLLSDAIEGRE